MGQVKSREYRPYTFLKMTTSTCPECLQLVQTRVIAEEGKVYFDKFCPQHGKSKALVSDDADYYLNAYRYARPGSQPHKFSTEVSQGCPQDCGLCADHQQHTCLPIIEITDHCNLECPICIVDNHHSAHMSVEDFRRIIDRLVEHEGSLETITLSGGEPTAHPNFLELVDIATRPEIGRVSVVTNGNRVAKSRSFCDALKTRNVYVILQFDALSDEAYRRVRGADLMQIKWQALENLQAFDIATQLAYVPVKGVNDDCMGEIIQLMLERDHVLSLLIQPVAYSGQGGGVFAHDPLDRLTITGVLNHIESQSAGLLRKDDFIPLPCSHPHCVSLTYLLKLDDGSYLPFPRFVDFEKHLDLFQQTATINADERTENTLRQVIDNLWSSAGEMPDCEKITGALKRALLEMYPQRKMGRDELIRITERQAKTIFIHHYMDRHNFDLERLVKCCHHYPLIDGRIMPACSHNMFYRGAAKGSNTPAVPGFSTMSAVSKKTS